jgi:hypothetical protein
MRTMRGAIEQAAHGDVVGRHQADVGCQGLVLCPHVVAHRGRGDAAGCVRAGGRGDAGRVLVNVKRKKWVSRLSRPIYESSHLCALEWIRCMGHRLEPFESATILLFDLFWIMGIPLEIGLGCSTFVQLNVGN